MQHTFARPLPGRLTQAGHLSARMTRERLDQSKVVYELVIDKAHYRQHPDCRTLVCFVYDPDHRLS